MAYTKTVWVNDIPPSIDEINLGKMEEGIYQNSLRIDDLVTLTTQHTEQLQDLADDIGALQDRMTTAENDINAIKGDIQTLESTKANASDVPTTENMNALLNNKLDKTTYNTFVNTTLPNTYYKKTETYTRSQIDSKVNGKLNNTGDTGNGNYTFNGKVNVKGTLSTTYEYIGFDSDNGEGFGSGGYKLYVDKNNPGGRKGDVWIKNA